MSLMLMILKKIIYTMLLPREMLMLGFKKKMENYFCMWLCMYGFLAFGLYILYFC
jgi:hypothetical protein